MIDVALALDALVPAAEYGGCLTGNTKEEYEALRWEDPREKPSWEAVQAVNTTPPPTSKEIIDILTALFSELPDELAIPMMDLISPAKDAILVGDYARAWKYIDFKTPDLEIPELVTLKTVIKNILGQGG
jgi:hypothetical protein